MIVECCKRRFLPGIILFILYCACTVFGDDLKSLCFNQKGYVECGDIFAVSEGTIEFWFKPVTINNNEWIVSIYKDQKNRMELGFGPTNLMFLVKKDGSSSYIYLDKEGVFPDTWHHVACAFTKEKAVIFLDGNASSVLRNGDYSLDHLKGGQFRIGAGANSSERYNGLVSEMRLSNRIRYKEDFTPVPDMFKADIHTVALWHFTGNDDQVIKESSGKKCDGKVIKQVSRSSEFPHIKNGELGLEDYEPEAFPCVRVRNAPVIDGKLDDACWSTAASAVDFLDAMDGSGSVPAPVQTIVKLAYDNDALYLSADCLEPNMERLTVSSGDRDSPVYNDDCLEFFLAPEKASSGYIHYIVNALGTYFDAFVKDKNWDSSIRVRAQMLKDRWILEAAFPFKEMKLKPPADGDIWTFNVAREHRTGKKLELSSWCQLAESSFHNSKEFARLQFVNKKLDSGHDKFSNRTPLLKNPFFSQLSQDEKPLDWIIAPGIVFRETAYLSGTYEMVANDGLLIAGQELGWRRIGGKNFNLTIVACGEGGNSPVFKIHYTTKNDKHQVMPIVWEKPADKTHSTYSKTITLPSNMEYLTSVEILRSKLEGELSIREIQFNEATIFKGVKEGKQRYPEHCWPISDPFKSPVDFKWGLPLAEGPLSVLLIVPASAARLTTELGQRFDMKADVAWNSSGQFYSWGNAAQINARLSRKLKPYDTIVLGVPMKDLLFANIIRENVKLGTGLVLIYDDRNPSDVSSFKDILPETTSPGDSKSVIIRQMPWNLLPQTKEGKLLLESIGVGKSGKGKIITLGYNAKVRGLLPDGYDLNQASAGIDDWWEYIYALVSHCLLESVAGSASAKIENMVVDAEKNELCVTIAASGKLHGSLTLAWKDQYHAQQVPGVKKDVNLAAGECALLTFAIPEAFSRARGNHLANFFLRDANGATIDWSTAVFPVKGTVRIGTEYPFPQDWYRKGEKVEGKISVENRSSSPADISVKLELIDNFGRSIWEKNKPFSPRSKEKLELAFSPKLDRIQTNYHRLRAGVYDKSGLLDQQEWGLRFPDQWKFDPGEFHLGAETGYCRYLHTDKVFADHFRNAGVTFSVDGGITDEMPQFEMPWAFLTIAGWHVMNSNSYPIRKNCFNDPDEIRKMTDYAAQTYPRAKRCGAVFCILHDELELIKDGHAEVCFCSHCTKAFRQWVNNTYGDLNRVNNEWETTLKSWEEVEPITADKVRQCGNYAQWVDFRTFMEDSFTNACAAVKEQVKQKYTDALIGHSNPFAINPFSGHDNVKLAQVEEAMIKYMRPDTMKECISLNPAAPALTHFGYDGLPEWCKWFPWWFAMNKGQFLVWWGPACGDPGSQLIDSFGSQTQRSKAVFETVPDLIAGIGKIFRTYSYARNRTAILCSQASMHTAWAESGMRVGDIPWGSRGMYQWAETAPLHGFKLHFRSQENFKALLKETSLQPDFITLDQVLKGRLKDYQILILPYSAALPEELMAEIDHFTKSGGTVLADLRTAAYSGHGKALPDRISFEAIFGIKRKKTGFNPAYTSLSYSKAFASIPAANGYDRAMGHEDIELTFGQAMARHSDGVPAVIVNKRGKGKAVYLNFVPGNGTSSTALMLKILKLSGLERQVKLIGEEQPVIGYECFVFERKPLKYLGVLRDMHPQTEDAKLSWHGHQFRHAGTDRKDITIELPGKYHVYDVRSGSYLGRKGKITTGVNPADAKVFGLLPYKITGVSIMGLKKDYRPGTPVLYNVSVAVSESVPGDHVMRVEVIDPDGVPSSCYTKNILAAAGRHEGIIPLALNEKCGAWTIEITDITSKISAKAAFFIKN